jgi:hypothetical protein
MDHLSGLGGVIAPFLLRYRAKDRLASAIQIAVGATTIIASLFTDYRAHDGLGRALRARPAPAGRRRHRLHPRNALENAGPA